MADLTPERARLDTEQYLATAAKDYYNTQLEVQKALAAQNTQLLSSLGLNKELKVNIIEIHKRLEENHRNVKKASDDRKTAEEELKTITDTVKRKEKKDTIESISQRMATYNAEIALLENMRKMGWIPIITAIGFIYRTFILMDKAAAAFRMKMGATRELMGDIRQRVENVSISLMHLGTSAEGVYQAMYSLGEVMGGVHNVSRDILETVSLFKAQLGIAEEDSAKFMKNMAAVSKSTMQSQKSLAYFTKSLSNAAGVPLPLVMKDVATLSGTTMNLMAKFPLQIVKAAVEFRRLGTTINDVAKASESILDFTNSVNKEMEASVLLGQSLNLQRARQLSYEGKLQAANEEMLNQARSLGFQNKMDYFQRKATAEALGMSVESIYAQLQAQDQIRDALNSSDPIVKKMADEYYRLKNLNEANAEIEGKSEENKVRALANQERMVSIQNKLNQVVAKLSEVFLPFVDKALGMVPALIDIGIGIAGWLVPLWTAAKIFAHFVNPLKVSAEAAWEIQKALRLAGGGFTDAYRAAGKLANFWRMIPTSFGGIITAINTLAHSGSIVGSIFSRIGSVIGWIVSAGSKLGALFKVFAPLGGAIAPFLKFVPILGLLITAFTFFTSLWTNFMKNKEAGMGIFEAGIRAVMSALYDTLIKPFVSAWKFIKSFWGGESPSQIGLSILTGLVSVGAMIFDALTSPWRMALAWIADKIPGMGSIAEKLRGGLSGIINTPIETKAMATYVPAVTVTLSGTKIEGNATVTTTGGGETTSKNDVSTLMTEETGKALIQAMNGIRDDLKAGLIGINMDGQLLSATLARQTEFRRGYGVNNIS